jgi:glutamate racemase
MRIGVFDSGVGGLTVLNNLVKKYPNNEYIYFGDIKNNPYGNKTIEELEKLASKIIEFLISKEVDLIVIACGTVSSNLGSILKNKYNIKIEGFYNITVYIDKYYGVIFNIEKEELEYYNYIKNQVDMKVIAIDTEFSYLVENIPFEIINKINIDIKDNNIFLKIKEELSNLEMMKLLEFSKVVYK